MNSFRSLVLPLRLRDRYGLWSAAIAALCKWRYRPLPEFMGRSNSINEEHSIGGARPKKIHRVGKARGGHCR